MARIRTFVMAACLLAAASTAVAAAPSTPKIVNAYAEQTGVMCRTPSGAPGPSLAPDRADLNGDGLPDWIFDSGRQSCVATNAMAKTYGALVTVFLATKEGEATPAFQQAAYGAHLERIAGKSRLVLTLGGSACREARAEARCERTLNWVAATKRLELGATGTSAEAAAAPKATR